jgi:hypothetical protein
VRQLVLAVVGVYGCATAAFAASDGASTLQLSGADGRRTVTAIETRAPIALDGSLDEEAWQLAQPANDFVQAEPHEGQAASEPTEVRVIFDRDALYIGVV